MAEVRALVAVPGQEVKMARFVPSPGEFLNIVGGEVHRIGPEVSQALSGWHGYVNARGGSENARFNVVATALARAAGGWPDDVFLGTAVFLGDTPSHPEADIPERLLALGLRMGLWRSREAR